MRGSSQGGDDPRPSRLPLALVAMVLLELLMLGACVVGVRWISQ